ncbi:MAG: carbamoyltransferase HypF, partial [Spirochaetales bacterium]|nr:carbamoyltransferase HypF [Spirochaetales bacterium]
MIARHIHVYGLVQGVGFRPFVYRIAAENGLSGWVKNTTRGVELEIQGSEAGVFSFLHSLEYHAPPLSRVERVISEETTPEAGRSSFEIIKSRSSSGEITRVSPDVCVCDDCLSDMETQPNRIDYPFTNCTNCGPRFTIIRDLPYDRGKTTMESFNLCSSCRAEYEDITNRRFHAQPNACADCGPVCTFTDRHGSFSEIRRVLTETAKVIDGGGIAAVKALGGFHLVCDALNEEAVGSLRRRKHREAKPFALMARDLETVRTFVLVSSEEEALLTGMRRPIVLLKRSSDPASSVAWGLDTLGVMLPCTPLQVLLFRYLKTP